MSVTKTISSVLMIMLLTPASTVAQSSNLDGRYAIELAFGMLSAGGTTVDVSHPTTSVTVKNNSVGGSLAFFYWPTQILSVGITLTGLKAEATTTTDLTSVSTQTSAVSPIMLAGRYYPFPSMESSGVCPNLQFSAGPVFGFQSTTSLSQVETRVEAAAGGRVGAGVDLILGRTVKLGLSAGYMFMSDFSAPIAGRSNYNGVDMFVGLGIMFGSGKGE